MSDAVREDFAGRTLFVGKMTVLSRITTESRDLWVAVLHLGGIDVRCSADEHFDGGRYETIKQDLLIRFGANRQPS